MRMLAPLSPALLARARIALAVLGLVMTQAAHAETAGLASHLLDSDRLLGDPAGVRTGLERLGIDLQLFYNQYLSAKPSGGGARSGDASGHSGSYDFFTRVDLEELSGWWGADMLLRVKGQYDRSVNPDVGALSNPIDDADFDSGIYVDELWIQQELLDGRLRLRVGFSEQQTVFDRNAFANTEDRQFLSSFLDNNGLLPLPNGLAAMLLVVPVPWLEIAAGVADADNRPRHAGFDTAFDGFSSLTGYLEARLQSPWEGRGLPGSFRFGVFLDGRKLTHFRSGKRDRGHLGAYLSFDQIIWREHAESDEGLGVFVRAGYADSAVNRVAWFWSVGFEYVGAIRGRDRDVLGFGSYQTISSSIYRDEIDSSFKRETGIELYYGIRALGWLVITPDFQYIIDPGATGDSGDAFVATLRFRVSF
jgi:porin